jgi:hypothetical protein
MERDTLVEVGNFSTLVVDFAAEVGNFINN